VGVAWLGSDTEFRGFIDNHGLTFTQLSDDAGNVYERFEIPYQPAVVVVRPDGEVETLYGAADEAVLDQLIGDALA
jgi:peroxiredoxin